MYQLQQSIRTEPPSRVGKSIQIEYQEDSHLKITINNNNNEFIMSFGGFKPNGYPCWSNQMINCLRDAATGEACALNRSCVKLRSN